MRLTLRIARPVRDLERARRQYAEGLDLDVLGSFVDHAGFDGVMLGRADLDWHLEFTCCRAHPVEPRSTAEDLLVLYVPEAGAYESRCARLLGAGFVSQPSFNPYWDIRGRTFEDLDGYRVVIQNAAWAPLVGSRG